MGYLMPKLSCQKNNRGTIQSIVGGNKGVLAFPKTISSEINVTGQRIIPLRAGIYSKLFLCTSSCIVIVDFKEYNHRLLS